MYTPKHFKETGDKEIIDFMRKHSFATIVSVGEKGPIATHIPVEVSQKDHHIHIKGHLSKANPQWKTFGEDDVLVIFQGPHAYVSASWYEQPNVSTWNYQAVHAYGNVNLVEEEVLKEMVFAMMNKYESHMQKPVNIADISTEVMNQNLKGIVGFELKVNRIEESYKLSQNRHEQDYISIMEHLKQSDEQGQQVASEMNRIRDTHR
ncbi:FMN-binding negative transcriptional regulator [Bacillus sp. CGMCC 1.16541]|uniref:FMN-binding negative transcriptional regulator n=1 Tax=Bacillus sp. CGMCC 1.16541 TaxID=2185143 RepID=UPI0019505A91|nr:FMN-binding negative transcriptional regulator [Bacillus sp. CGMCC 1.16541]